jgi:hypothetical protein
MAKEKNNESNKGRAFHVQFTLPGLVGFILSFTLATGVLAYAFARPSQKSAPSAMQHDPMDPKPPQIVPAWGELLTFDTQMERPEEYTAQEVSNLKEPRWIFSGMQPAQVRQLMLSCGLTPEQADRALASRQTVVTPTNTIVHPDDTLVFALSPETRAKFYGELAKDAANHYMHFPFCFAGEAFQEIAGNGRIQPEVVAKIRSLLYRRGDALFLSDFEVLMKQIPAEAQRVELVKVLSAQSAVLARVRIRPTTDIDKLLGYWAWAPGVRFTNLRPLLDSIKRLQDGATVSLLYFLPQFARERLYTYPLPAQVDDPAMDCHWSTMNFFNDPPDNRFVNPTYTVSYLRTNYYTVAKPTRYGDLIFVLDEKGNAIHSAVYIADDIVFTKNGNNYMEPWMLMRMKNLISMYSVMGSPRTAVYRNRDS